ncbi:MAG TPA: class I SAM-dependent methyltransferase [bacterium]|nr:class I SAM-dependent methyltransferase [bacterium]
MPTRASRSTDTATSSTPSPSRLSSGGTIYSGLLDALTSIRVSKLANGTGNLWASNARRTSEASGLRRMWVGYILASPPRRLVQDPERLRTPYVHAGITVLEPGPGMGFFTLELARLVGPAGRVIAVDIEPRMIAGLQHRARKVGLLDRIDARVVQPTSMGLRDVEGMIDFVFAFFVVHEMPASAAFFVEVARALKPGASLFLAEPVGHVGDAAFTAEITAAALTGLSVDRRSLLRGSRAALLRKPAA